MPSVIVVNPVTFRRDEYNQDGVGDVRRLTCFGGAGAALGPALGLALGPIFPGAAPVLCLGALPVVGSRLPAILAGAEEVSVRVINRPGVAGAVLKTALSLID